MDKKIKIGFLGMGTVAQGVWKHLCADRDVMKRRFASDYELSKVFLRNPDKKRGVVIPTEKITLNPADVVQDPSIDIVCELMGGTDIARKLTLDALKAGKIVVSANKALICEYGSEIFEAAKKYGGAYFFEASVAGGIPIIKILREGLVANRFSKIYGILNGTCNYILTRMERENSSYETVIADARRLGYVEADESLDIDGWDAAHKISILAYLAYGVWIKPSNMLVRGIRGIRQEDMLYAKDYDCRIKLIASVRKNPHTGELFAMVAPTLLPLSDVVANVNDVYNAVSIEGDVVGRTVHIGRGAGQDATSSAVIADISDAARLLLCGSEFISGASNGTPKLASFEDVTGEFYLRVEVEDTTGVLSKVSAILAEEGISIELFQQRRHEIAGRAWLLFSTHETSEAAISRACAKISEYSKVFAEPFVLRTI